MICVAREVAPSRIVRNDANTGVPSSNGSWEAFIPCRARLGVMNRSEFRVYAVPNREPKPSRVNAGLC